MKKCTKATFADLIQQEAQEREEAKNTFVCERCGEIMCYTYDEEFRLDDVVLCEECFIQEGGEICR